MTWINVEYRPVQLSWPTGGVGSDRGKGFWGSLMRVLMFTAIHDSILPSVTRLLSVKTVGWIEVLSGVETPGGKLKTQEYTTHCVR